MDQWWKHALASVCWAEREKVPQVIKKKNENCFCYTFNMWNKRELRLHNYPDILFIHVFVYLIFTWGEGCKNSFFSGKIIKISDLCWLRWRKVYAIHNLMPRIQFKKKKNIHWTGINMRQRDKQHISLA